LLSPSAGNLVTPQKRAQRIARKGNSLSAARKAFGDATAWLDENTQRHASDLHSLKLS
jgi:hypothetical protein